MRNMGGPFRSGRRFRRVADASATVDPNRLSADWSNTFCRKSSVFSKGKIWITVVQRDSKMGLMKHMRLIGHSEIYWSHQSHKSYFLLQKRPLTIQPCPNTQAEHTDYTGRQCPLLRKTINDGTKANVATRIRPNIFQGADSAETRGMRYASTKSMRVG